MSEQHAPYQPLPDPLPPGEPLATVQVRPSRSLSIIWLLPLIAALIGGWLLYRALAEAPVEITIDFPTGTGIDVGKTKVMHEGIVAGVVKELKLKPAQGGVEARVDMDRSLEALLRSGTRFWLVKPEISLSGVTGLETIVTGNYIAARFSDEGAPARHFTALEKPPALDDSVPGLRLKLLAKDLGSVYVGAPVLYKKILVGEVLEYTLDAARDRVVLDVHIRAPYDSLVTKKTRFWNASGLQVQAGLDGLDVRMESLVSLVKGGIAFDAAAETDTDAATGAEAARNGDEFHLYRDFDSAKRGVRVMVRFDSNAGIAPRGAKVLYKGFEAGEVKSLRLSPDHQFVEARLVLSPEMEEHLNTGTRFWLVKPEISLAGVSGLDTLFKGNYIEMDVGEGAPARTFDALKKPPLLDEGRPGLRLRLRTAELGSLSRGSPVLYRRIPVGSVQGFRLTPRQDAVWVDLLIEPEYARLVNRNTRFWNASGMSVSGNLSKVTFRTESLAAILQGGVGFFNPPPGNGVPATQGAEFSLYPDYEAAQEQGIPITISMAAADGIEAGTAIRFQGLPVGTVKAVTLKPDLSGVVVEALLHMQPERFARDGSVFWLVQPRLGITGATHLETLVKGRHFEVQPGTGAPRTQFAGRLDPPLKTGERDGLNLVLLAPRLGSIKEGLAVYYREVPVGKVTGYRLGDTAENVQVFVNIEPRFSTLVRQGSRFWNASGVSIDVGLFKGAKIKTESLESILAGGIAFATPDNGLNLPRARSGEVFSLNGELKEEWLAWKPRIPLPP